MPVIALFLQHKGFGFTEIGFIVFIFMISSLIFEIPTGYLGDKFGRKNSVLVGLLTLVIIAVCWALGEGLYLYFVMAAIWMMGLAFISGSFEAYLYDYLKEKNLTEFYDGVISKSTMFFFISTAIGMVLGMYAFSINPNYPFYLLAITCGFSFFIVLFMKNDTVQLSSESLNKNLDLLSGIKHILKSKNLIWITFFLSFFFCYDHFFVNSVNVPYLVSLKTVNLAQIGFFLAGMSIVQSFFAAKFDILRKKLCDNQIIVGLAVLQIASLLGMSYLFGVGGLFSYLMFSMIEPFEPLLTNSFSQKFINSNIRATTISSIKLVGSTLTSIVGVFVGMLVDTVGIRVSFLYVAVSFAIIMLILFAFKKYLKIQI
jgi:MFS family permease